MILLEQCEKYLLELRLVRQSEPENMYSCQIEGVDFYIGISDSMGELRFNANKINRNREDEIIDYLIVGWHIEDVEEIKLIFRKVSWLKVIVARALELKNSGALHGLQVPC